MTEADKRERHPVAAAAGECRATLDRVLEDMRWAYAAGWGTRNRPLDEPKGAALYVAGSGLDDKVPGARHDIGVGDYAARRALGGALGYLVDASGALDLVAQMVQAVHRVPRPAPLRPVSPTLDAIGRAARQVRAQLDLAAVDEWLEPLNAVATAHAAQAVEQAANLLTLAAKALDRWSESARPSTTLPPPMCPTCHLRERPSRGRRTARECDTCATWRVRHKGKPRPRSMDEGDRDAGKMAAQRRRAAGQGWGMA